MNTQPLSVLFIMDPLEALKPELDTSILLLREMAARGHETWICDVPDVSAAHVKSFALAEKLRPLQLPGDLHARIALSKKKRGYKPFKRSKRKRRELSSFDLIVIRKEPPFDAAYYYLTLLLDRLVPHIPVVNDPAGIRSTNEKLAILNFPEWIPETLVSSQVEELATFQAKLKGPMILKPLNNRGGRGVERIAYDKKRFSKIKKMTQNATSLVMAQKYIKAEGDKRITLLNGKVLAAYWKQFSKTDFRGNFTQGATYHKTKISATEQKIIRAIRPYIRRNGLSLVGIDIIENRLIDFNVTCPGGLVESTVLYPHRRLATQWAVYLEGRCGLK